MIEPLAVATYRGAMTLAAGAAGLVSRMPGAPTRWQALGERLGRLPPAPVSEDEEARGMWFHAASVGELLALRPLLTRLRERHQDRRFVVTTLTRTGLEVAREMRETDVPALFPLDAPGAVRRMLRHVRLEAFFFTETEIWPTCLQELAAVDVPAFMVSGRVSERTARRTRLLRPLYRGALSTVHCCMQTDDDSRRIIALGADPRRVRVAGSLKYDGATAETPPDVSRLATAVAGRRVMVAGSTHEGEDEMVLGAFARLTAGRSDLVLLLAPRHPQRFPAVAAAIEARAMPLRRYTQMMAGTEPLAVPGGTVVLLDAVGPLAQCYALGVVAFVGGSLVPVGGHNVLEPARAARPILVGPHTGNAGEVVERLVAGGGALRVGSEESLAWALAGLLDEPVRAMEMGRRARALIETGQGAVERHLRIIAARLGSRRFAEEAEGP